MMQGGDGTNEIEVIWGSPTLSHQPTGIRDSQTGLNVNVPLESSRTTDRVRLRAWKSLPGVSQTSRCHNLFPERFHSSEGGIEAGDRDSDYLESNPRRREALNDQSLLRLTLLVVIFSRKFYAQR